MGEFLEQILRSRGGLSPEAAERLRQQLQTPGGRRQFVEESLDQVLLAEALRTRAMTPSEPAVNSLEAAASAPALPRRQWVRPLLTAASIALLAVCALMLRPGGADHNEPPVQVTGSFWLERGDERLPALLSRAELKTNDVLHVPLESQATVKFRGEETELVVEADSSLLLHSLRPAKSVTLRQGALSAYVAPQSREHPLTIALPFGTATVVGTSFRIETASTSAALSVMSGTVQLARPGEPPVDVKSGMTSLMSSNTATVLRETRLRGVNDHWMRKDYRDIPVSKKLELVSKLGANAIRLDLPPLTNAPAIAEMDRLVQQARAHGQEIVPILLYVSADWWNFDDPAELQRECFSTAQFWASRYKAGAFRVWNLGDAMDLRCLRGARGDGGERAHFDSALYDLARAAITGWSEGVRSVDPQAKFAVDLGRPTHTGFIDRLIDDDVAFDVIGFQWRWHAQFLHDAAAQLVRYGRPLWIVELSQAVDFQMRDDLAQQLHLAQSLREARNLPFIQAIFIYELLDEPFAAPAETMSGLVYVKKNARTGKWFVAGEKPAFAEVQKIFRAERMQQ